MHKLTNSILNTAAVFALLIVVLATPAAVFADQYGGGKVTQISLNKTVRDPSTGNFVDNLGVDTSRFAAGDTVTYRLVITNSGDTSFGFVDVTDTLPSFLEFVSGPGSFNASNRQVTFRLENVTPGSSQTRDIVTRVVAKENLPSDSGVFCIVNAASVVTNDNRTASDTAQVCVGQPVPGKPVKVIKALPNTGSYEIIVLGLLAGSAISMGTILRRAK